MCRLNFAFNRSHFYENGSLSHKRFLECRRFFLVVPHLKLKFNCNNCVVLADVDLLQLESITTDRNSCRISDTRLGTLTLLCEFFAAVTASVYGQSYLCIALW